MRALDPQIKILVQSHRETSTRWMPHEVVPWGAGEDYIEKPWRPEQCGLRPEIVMALETNLLTEDNLPFYFPLIASGARPESALGESDSAMDLGGSHPWLLNSRLYAFDANY